MGRHWGICVMLFLTLSTFGVISSTGIAEALSIDPLRSGSISALMNGVPFVSAGVTAALTGLLRNHTARPMTGVILGCVVGAAAALWLLVLRNKSTASGANADCAPMQGAAGAVTAAHQ
jgi:DHA1 family bicyclomycin/chloramphenicol resistance-like MFS transporter